MKEKILQFTNSLLLALLSFLGFSCADTPIDEPVVSYGTPSSVYKVKGVVTNKNNEPIKDLLLIVQGKQYFESATGTYSYRDSIYTDKNGAYNGAWSEYPSCDEFKLTCKDVDGDLNGSYQTKEITFDYEGVQFTGGDGSWNQGEAEKTLDIQLNEVVEDANEN